MSDLVLAAYSLAEAAEDVLGVIRAHQVALPGPLDSSATVRVAPDGSYTVTTTDRKGPNESLWGVFWEALFGLVFLVPAAGTAYGSSLGGLFGAIDRAGLDADFRARTRAALGSSSSSGLALLATGWNPETVVNQVSVRPVTLVRASLVLEPNSELMRELGGVPPGHG